VWRDRAEAIVEQLRDYRLVPPNGGWPLLADTARLGLTPAEGSARLSERGRVAATPMAGGGPAGQRYLRLMFASEPVERLAGLRRQFAAAF
jgi:aspartate/methionine/tyrosine aminotransferase